MKKCRIEVEQNNNHIKTIYFINENFKEVIFETNLSSICGITKAFINNEINNINDNDIYLIFNKVIALILETLNYKIINGIYFKSFIDDKTIDFRNDKDYDYRKMFLINWRITQLMNIGLKNYEDYLENKPIFLSDKFVEEINNKVPR